MSLGCTWACEALAVNGVWTKNSGYYLMSVSVGFLFVFVWPCDALVQVCLTLPLVYDGQDPCDPNLGDELVLQEGKWMNFQLLLLITLKALQ